MGSIRTTWAGGSCATSKVMGPYVASGPVHVVTDGLHGTGRFEETLIVSAETGNCAVDVLVGPVPPEFGPTSSSKRAQGCGWVLSAKSPVHIDHDHDPLPQDVSFPVPFFVSAESGQPMQLAQADQRTVLIDEFRVDDKQALKVRQWRVQNASDLFELDSKFQDGARLNANHMSHLNAAHWQVEVPQPNDGLVLYRLYDRFHGRQRARVLVNGAQAGWWYEPRESRSARWAWSRFGIGPEFTDKPLLTLSIDPPAGVPLWSVAEYRLYAILRD